MATTFADTTAIPTPRAGTGATRVGWALTGLVGTFYVFDFGLKLVAPEFAIANGPELGWPREVATYYMLAGILAVATLLYLVPRTAVLGAILLTAYLGGAVASHVRVGSPLFSHVLFGVYLGIMTWGGLWLREPRLRALMPFRS